jgi:hypothetical protein
MELLCHHPTYGDLIKSNYEVATAYYRKTYPSV